MDFSKLIEEIKSGVVHFLFLNPRGEKVGSGSGFLVKGKVVTCDHVIAQPYPEDTTVHIRFEDSSKEDTSSDTIFTLQEIRKRIESSSPEDKNDYCELHVPEIKYADRYNFGIEDAGRAEVGTEILLMGYPFDHLN